MYIYISVCVCVCVCVSVRACEKHDKALKHLLCHYLYIYGISSTWVVQLVVASTNEPKKFSTNSVRSIIQRTCNM